jgi:hypothetical protein
MTEFITSKIARCILYTWGWSLIEASDEKNMKFAKGKNIMAISHSSVWDALIFLIYKYAYPEILSNSLIVVKPQIYDAVPLWVQSILDKIGFVKATAYEQKNGGFVKATSELLNQKKKFLFLISPKGARENYPWRSGYFALAKELGCNVCACGLDYEKKKIVVFEPISVKDKTREEVEPILQKQIGSIVPLYPNCSEVELRQFNPSRTSLFRISFFIIMLILFIFFLYYYSKKILLLFVLLFIILI